MPLPDGPISLQGGCNCHAIRYRIKIPSREQRPSYPNTDGAVRFPFVITDHCNDCRRAVAAILPTWICTPTSMISVRLAPRSQPPVPLERSAEGETGEVADDKEGWGPADELLRPGAQKAENSWLCFFKSSERTTRTFCGRCGTNLFYSVWPMVVEGYPDLFDVILPTIDRHHLQQPWMKPDRHLWWEYGIDWVKDWTRDGLPTHEDYRIE